MMKDVLSNERLLNPFPWYRAMRESQPVYHNAQRGSWSVFRYDDVKRVLSDYETFSSRFQGGNGQAPEHSLAASMISTDPPKHRQLRQLVEQAFTPRAVEALAPRIESIVDELLDQVAERGEMDVVRDLAYPLPVIVIAELLGIPSEDREQFKQWSDAMVTMATTEQMAGRPQPNRAQREMSVYFMNVIEQRRRDPGDDLISGLLEAEIEGRHLSEMELLGFCNLLLVAGNETTTNLLGNAILTFTEHPAVWDRLGETPALIPSAIEEVLRYRSPVQSMFRVTRRETTIGDATLPAHASVVAWIGSANRDAAQFPEPERFDVEREPNRHIAFGHGIHYCLGAPLARLEGKIALTAMVERFRTIQRVPDVALEPLPSMIVYGVQSLPVKITGV